MRILIIKAFFLIMLLLNLTHGYSQDIYTPHKDSLIIESDSLIIISDSSVVAPIQLHDSINSDVVINDTSTAVMDTSIYTFKPDPKKAIIYSAIFPGLGQIYNRKYWKLPIVYGGFIGLSYAISWNNRYYVDYSQGYKDIMDDDPDTDSWKNFLSYGQDPDSIDKEWLKDVMKRRKDFYRRYRDLSIIGTVAVYALCIVDAYVDAQLFDFDMSQDLSFRVEPVIIPKTKFSSNSLGLYCSITF